MNVAIQEICGAWRAGYVLDRHVKCSKLIGYDEFGHHIFDTTRTEIGEAIYQLKYRGDRQQIPLLADAFVDNLKSKLTSVRLIIPVPPSKHRKFQPLIELAKAVAVKMKIPIYENILIKNVETPQMKDISANEDKLNKLLESFSINDVIEGDVCWNALVIDDLYSSGASLNAATITLKTYSKVNDIYVAAFTRTK